MYNLAEMAFPLAHPVAALPFRHRYLKWLDFPALVIGTLVPDVGYLFDEDVLSHQVFGSILFGLPSGALLLAAFYAFRAPVVSKMPGSLRRSMLPLCRRPLPAPWIIVVSLVIGIWTHVLWDSLTHPDGWLVQHIPFLLYPAFRFKGRTARVCTLLWYASSFLGVGCLLVAFEKWKNKAGMVADGKEETGKGAVQDAVFLGILVVAVSLVHHLVHSPVGYVLTGILCLSFGIIFIWKMAVASG
jgi:hypothetical protein